MSENRLPQVPERQITAAVTEAGVELTGVTEMVEAGGSTAAALGGLSPVASELVPLPLPENPLGAAARVPKRLEGPKAWFTVLGLSAVTAVSSVFAGEIIAKFAAGNTGPESSLIQTATCPAVSPAALTAARRILAAPQSRYVDRAENDISAPVSLRIKGRAAQASFVYNRDERDLAHMRSQAAHANGLTVHNPLPYNGKLYDDLAAPGGPRQPFSIYFDTARDFLAKYGVALQIGGRDYQYVENGRAPQPGDLNTVTAREDMANLIEAFGYMPRQYVRLAGLRHVILMANHKSPDAAYAVTSGAHDTIVENVSDQLLPAVTWHEAGHEMDADECGGPAAAAHDPHFTVYNGGVAYNSDSRPIASTAYSNITNKESGLVSSQIENIDSGRYAAACSDEKRMEQIGGNVVFTDPYGGTDDLEDKAQEMAAMIPDDGYQALLDPFTPRLRAKFTYLFGRLFQLSPRLAHYFGTVSDRPFTSSFVAKYCAPHASAAQKLAAVHEQQTQGY